MGIQTELTRIINAKAAIKTAIEGKGVTVPDGILLDGMASLIESIEVGGGGGEGGYFDLSLLGDVNFAKSGSFTSIESGTSVEITDAEFLQVTPKFFVLYTESVLTTTDRYLPLAVVQANISADTGFILGVYTKGLKYFYFNTSSYKPYNFNAMEGGTTDYDFSSSYAACRMTSGGIQISACGPNPYSYPSGTALFEAGATYNYVFMGVKP